MPTSGPLNPPLIYWIGGSPCAGKSSVARLLARSFGLYPVECDLGTELRLAAMAAAQLPVYTELARLGTCARLAMPPQWQADREVDFYREQFRFIVAELAALDSSAPLVVEGADLLPELLADVEVSVEHAVWMVPTPEFQLRHYAARDWARSYVARCPDPGLAFANWMRRDTIYADYVQRTAAERGGRVLVVDGSRSTEATAQRVALHFGL
jgi:2-phosphoglycerate kinase